MKQAFALLFIAAVMLPARADTVVLKTGQALEGKILKNDDNGIQLQVEYGTMMIAQDKILRVEEDTPETLAAREEKEAAEKEHAEKMRAEGKVLYKGKWVAEKERDADLAKQAELKKKREAELAAKKKAEAAARKKREEEEAAREEKELAAAAERDNADDARSNGRRGTDQFRRRHGRDDRAQTDGRTPGNDGIRDALRSYDQVLRNGGINADSIQRLLQNQRRQKQ